MNLQSVVRLTLLLWFVLALTLEAKAQGASYLSLCSPTTDCHAVKRTWRGQPTIITGWLEQTFGAECKCADELLRSRKQKVIRVHLMNSVCMRNKRCGQYELLHGETIHSANNKIHRQNRQFMRRYDRVVRRFKNRLTRATGNVQCYVSPCLECDLDGKARRILATRVSAALPDCNIVDNPLRSACLPEYICEKHGTNPTLSAPCIVDLDGIDGSYINVDKYALRYRHCDISYYWEPWMNCIRGSFIDPRKRDCKYDSSLYDYTKGVLCHSFLGQSFDTCSH